MTELPVSTYPGDTLKDSKWFLEDPASTSETFLSLEWMAAGIRMPAVLFSGDEGHWTTFRKRRLKC
jgi:hypothetical protein